MSIPVLFVLYHAAVLDGTVPRIWYIGSTDAGARLIMTLGQGVIMRITSGSDEASMAGIGLATRVEYFSLALSSAMGILPNHE